MGLGCWYSPPLRRGWRFLYRIQQEQKQHNITVIMMMAATTPNITPNNNGSLQQRHKALTGMYSRGCVLQNRRFLFLWSQISTPGSVDNINNSIMMIIVMIMTMETIIKLNFFIWVFAKRKCPITQHNRDIKI